MTDAGGGKGMSVSHCEGLCLWRVVLSSFPPSSLPLRAISTLQFLVQLS